MRALTNCTVYTGGDEVLRDHAVVLDGARIVDVVATPPAGCEAIDLDGRAVAPGFIDLQVNGGGDALFNDDPSVETLGRIVAAHRRFGTTAMLPTFITGSDDGMRAAQAAVAEWIGSGEPGVLGLHLEGPFLNPVRKGVHDAALMRRMTAGDLDLVAGTTLLTLAPEQVDDGVIRELDARGIRVSAGHTDAKLEQALAGFAEGATSVTHLFNAMSPLQSREPGVVGAALVDPDVWCGIIVDGHHVNAATVRVAWLAKPRGKLLLVTDAMPPVGGEHTRFRIGAHEASVDADGRCSTAEGKLAGSALDMASAVRNTIELVGVPIAEALRMASTYPAEFLGLAGRLGRIAPGFAADLVVFEGDVRVTDVFVHGERTAA